MNRRLDINVLLFIWSYESLQKNRLLQVLHSPQIGIIFFEFKQYEIIVSLNQHTYIHLVHTKN